MGIANIIELLDDLRGILVPKPCALIGCKRGPTATYERSAPVALIIAASKKPLNEC